MIPTAIRALEPQDISAIVRIQTSSPQAAQWERRAYENIGRSGEKGWVAERDGWLAGFVVVRVVAREMEILNLAVAAGARRQGLGGALLEETLGWGARGGVERVFLEVRASNAAARGFYRRHGFSPAGMRRQYYRDPVEDALVLSAEVAREKDRRPIEGRCADR